MKAQDEEEVTFDFPAGVGGGKMDGSRDASLRGGPGSVMSLDSSRDGLTSAAGSETHMVGAGWLHVYVLVCLAPSLHLGVLTFWY